MTALVKQSFTNSSIMMLATFDTDPESTNHTKISSDTQRHKYTLMHACLHVRVSQQMNLTVAPLTTKVTV